MSVKGLKYAKKLTGFYKKKGKYLKNLSRAFKGIEKGQELSVMALYQAALILDISNYDTELSLEILGKYSELLEVTIMEMQIARDFERPPDARLK